MKKLMFLLFFCSSFCFALPQVGMHFTANPPSTVLYGNTVRIPVEMRWVPTVTFPVLNSDQWILPSGIHIEYVTGYCPASMTSAIFGYPYICYLNIVIPGNSFGTVSGPLKYDICKRCRYKTPEHVFYTPSFSITVIPHSLSMSTIPIQKATANQSFVYNLKSAVKYYDENAKAGFPAQGIVSPAEQDGLRFDQAKFSIVGTPKRSGTYLFKVGAKNTYGTAAPVDFRVQVQANAKDKPVFKQHHPMASALPDQNYSMNLMELVELKTGFMVTNQISFRIDTHYSHPDWLHIASNDATLLEGKVPPYVAGQEVEVTLIASSNTGGDSLPLTVKIPIAHDPAKKPVINSFKLEKLTGTNIYEDLSVYIDDPAHDSNLKLTLEKVEPSVTWLNISSVNPTVLEGAIPDNATGQKYLLTLRANTSIGGSSEPVRIPLQISVDKKLTPYFKADQPLLPMLYPGQPFFYDFAANQDIYPEYNDTPYTIKFAKGFNPPTWLRIEKNKLISDFIPDNIGHVIEIKVVIINIPGGKSGKNLLKLIVMK